MKMNNRFRSLSQLEMKKVKGGVNDPFFKWLCNVDGYYYETCYRTQPQIPCGYSQPCTYVSACPGATIDTCVV